MRENLAMEAIAVFRFCSVQCMQYIGEFIHMFCTLCSKKWTTNWWW